MDENKTRYNCPLCGDTFYAYDEMRKDVRGCFWCEPCQDDFDSVDWDAVRES